MLGKWLSNNGIGYEQKKAPAFTAKEMKAWRDWKDPTNLLLCKNLMSFCGYFGRLRAIEYLRLEWEYITIYIKGCIC